MSNGVHSGKVLHLNTVPDSVGYNSQVTHQYIIVHHTSVHHSLVVMNIFQKEKRGRKIRENRSVRDCSYEGRPVLYV